MAQEITTIENINHTNTMKMQTKRRHIYWHYLPSGPFLNERMMDPFIKP